MACLCVGQESRERWTELYNTRPRSDDNQEPTHAKSKGGREVTRRNPGRQVLWYRDVERGNGGERSKDAWKSRCLQGDF